MKIEVSERLMDYWIDEKGQRQPKFHAQIEGKPGIWSAGRSLDDAVGNLIRTHPEQFGVTIAFLGKSAR